MSARSGARVILVFAAMLAAAPAGAEFAFEVEFDGTLHRDIRGAVYRADYGGR